MGLTVRRICCIIKAGAPCSRRKDMAPRLHLSFYQRREVDHMTDFEMLSIVIMIISLVVAIQNHKKDK